MKLIKIFFKAFIFLVLFLIGYLCAMFLLTAMFQDFEYAKDNLRYIMGSW
jgi:hypothetical protein